MEATSVIQKPQKKQKLNEEQDINRNKKCLSDFPDDVLLHILSFLPTSLAVRTSLYSKRWEYLWTSIPNLDFVPWVQSAIKEKRTLLINFVERALCLRDSSDIKKFRLHCDVQQDASRVNTWIFAVVRHNVQELYLQIDNFEGEFSLPYCLFTCKTLTILRLRMRHILKLPATICFSNLKTLAIENITFSDEYLTQQLFSGMPVLEELELHECSWGDLKVVSISAPMLHSLSIEECHAKQSSNGNDCQVMIFGGSLKEFNYSGDLFNEYCLYNSFSLEKAEIHTCRDRSKLIASRMFKLLVGLSNVKFLRLFL